MRRLLSERRKKGAQRQRTRLAALVAHARSGSPYYRESYRNLSECIDAPALLPVTEKKALMVHFDDWVTDRGVTIEKVRALADHSDLVGELFLGKFTVKRRRSPPADQVSS